MTRDPSTDPASEPAPAPSELVRQFVEHWGMMARAWGINPTMGELFALLYITGADWTADDLREHLRISRGNASMNLRELMNWGVIHKSHRQGERREYYRAEGDVWTLFRRILAERRRRELAPTLDLLDRTARRIQGDAVLEPALRGRVVALQRFFRLINLLTTRLAALEPDELQNLLQMLGDPDAADDPPSEE